MSEIITDQNSPAFIEQKCCITHNDQTFCSGGSYLCIRKDTGKMEGILYGQWDMTQKYEGYNYVSSWDGSLKIRAIYGREYRNNWGVKCRYVWFRYQERYFAGRWDGCDNSQIVRVREITEKSYFRRR